MWHGLEPDKMPDNNQSWHSRRKPVMKRISDIAMGKRKIPAEESRKCIRNWQENGFGRN